MPNKTDEQIAQDVAKERAKKTQSWAEWIMENIIGPPFSLAGRRMKKKRKQIEGEEKEPWDY